MKTLFVIFSLLLVMPVYAETIVERQTTITQQPGRTTTTSQTTTRPAVVSPSTKVTTTTTTTQAPIQIGMYLSDVYVLMGPPTFTKVFRNFNSRRGNKYYDQRLTYQQPTGATIIFIKNSRVADIQYEEYRNVQQSTTTTTVEQTQYR